MTIYQKASDKQRSLYENAKYRQRIKRVYDTFKLKRKYHGKVICIDKLTAFKPINLYISESATVIIDHYFEINKQWDLVRQYELYLLQVQDLAVLRELTKNKFIKVITID